MAARGNGEAGRTPMMAQYRALKAEQPDALLFFRLGDFYELFAEDALVAAPLLGVQLTSRDGETPMCGVPHHAWLGYARRLLDVGYRVAVAEQMEDPALARGLVDRRIVRVLSPGTYVPGEEEAAEATALPRLAALWVERLAWGWAVLELGSGQVAVAEWGRERGEGTLLAEWARWRPAEVVANRLPELPLPASPRIVDPDPARAREAIRRLGAESARGLGLEDRPRALKALGLLAAYLARSPQAASGPPLARLTVYDPRQALMLSRRELNALAVFAPAGEPSLYRVLNQARTRMGSRLLERWLAAPLTDPAALAARQARVTAALADPVGRARLRERLGAVGDLELPLARLSTGQGSPRDLAALAPGLQALDGVVEAAAALGWEGPPPAARAAWREAAALLNRLLERPAGDWEEGGILRPGSDPEVDRLRE
ncbi:MAG: DNA mismatch repair protein MutS, partial [Firmicutes bacterium]|nr:DNA mismatch repair protein MutS [Bacillota bacterium]